MTTIQLGMPTSSFGMIPPHRIVRQGASGRQLKSPYHIPTLVHLEITYACMESCIMCYNPTRTKVNQRDKDVVLDIVNTVAEQRIPHTYLIGGEPTYGYSQRELSDMVDILFENGSSTTIVTNGQIHLKGFNPRLACFGVSIHGADAETHDAITKKRGSFKRACEAVRRYVDDGHDVRFVTVVMGRNHDQMYRICELAHELGAESIYYDIYEPGGIGEMNSALASLRMQPTHKELHSAIGQILAAHDEIPMRGDVALGTALPYCFDQRLAEAGMLSTCGAGTWFAAVTATGDLRLCNQSKMTFGNVLERPLAAIWSDPLVDTCFRDLSWVSEPCSSCPVLLDCGGGCKVDEGCPTGELCIDRIVRSLPAEQRAVPKLPAREPVPAEVPSEWRQLRVSPWLAVTETYRDSGDLFFKTRYGTVRVTEDELALAKSLISAGPVVDEHAFAATYSDVVDVDQMRQFLSNMVRVSALSVEK